MLSGGNVGVGMFSLLVLSTVFLQYKFLEAKTHVDMCPPLSQIFINILIDYIGVFIRSIL